MPGQDVRHPGSPRSRRRNNLGARSVADRRRGDEGDERVVLVRHNGGLDFTELRLEDVLDGLRLDAVAPNFELRVDSAEEVHPLRSDVDLAFVPGAVEAAELRMRDELLRGLFRQVAVPARKVHASDAELSDLSVRQWAQLPHLEDHVRDVRKRRADGDGLSRP